MTSSGACPEKPLARERPASGVQSHLRPSVFMFPGLGDHYVGMAHGLYQSEPFFAAELDRLCAALAPELGVDLRQLIYPASLATQTAAPASAAAPSLDLRRMLGRVQQEPDAAARRLNQTQLLQPALFVVEYALARLWLRRELRLDAMIGYSLGEYVAACLAGVIAERDALTLVARRAQLIAELPAGVMLAVPLAEAQLQPLLGAQLSLAAVNGPDFCVAAGPEEAIAALEKRLLTDGTVSRRVQSTHAFHSKMMAPIADRLTQLTRTFALRPPAIPYVSNVTGEFITKELATDPSYFSQHLCRPVRFADGMRALWQRPERVFIELGPGKTLSSLALLHAAPQAGEPVIVSTLRYAYETASDVELQQRALARLQAAGALSGPDEVTPAAAPTVAQRPPRSAVEQTLAAIWRELLRVESIGLDDHFFDRGGSSLLATRVIFRIRKALRIDVPLRRLFAAPTLAELAAVVDELLAEREGAAPSSAKEQRPAPAVISRDTAAPAGLRRFVLPDGTEIAHQNEAETRHFYHDIFEQRGYLKHGVRIPDGACVFDVGANIGLFTLFASREARDVTIHAFEPAPPIFDILSHNVARHGVRAQLHNFGLSDKEQKIELTYYPHSTGMSSFHADLDEEKAVLRALMRNQERAGMKDGAELSAFSEELLEVRFASQKFPCGLRRIGDVIAEHNIARIDLLKVDVQKCEREVLDGLREEDWPKLLQLAIEVHDIGGRVAALQALLAARGYDVFVEQDPLYADTNIYNLYALRR